MEKDQRAESGFSLVELLVVIVILGILSSVAVFAVRAITDRGESNGCAMDRRTLEQAEDANYALNGRFGTEDDLITAGLLHDPSQMHDLSVVAGEYVVTPVGICADNAGHAVGPIAATWGGLPALRMGTGPDTVLLTSAGTGNAGAAAIWSQVIATPLPPTVSLYLVDTSAFGVSPTAAQLQPLVTPAPAFIVWFHTVSSVVDSQGQPVAPADFYAQGMLPGRTCVIATLNDLAACNNNLPITTA